MLTFCKMHSLGNDFVVIDGVTTPTHLDSEKIAALADRNRGVGFDQLLLVAPPSQPDCDFEYVIFNADGSEAEQCGNGTRCVTDFVHRQGLSRKSSLFWHSKGGVFQTALRPDGMIETCMPEPRSEAERVPFIGQDSNGDTTLRTEVGDFTVHPISVGNPHGVVFVGDVIGLDVERIGSALSNHPAFPERANIGFCQIINPGFVRLRVFERGAAETLACGSGASAAVVAGRMAGKLGDKVKVSLPGGKLKIEWPNGQGPIKLIGDSTFVYRGQMDT
jgi:diaminopimelate epimerase